MPRVRITVRGLMVAVAVLAVLLALGIEARLRWISWGHRQKAAMLASKENELRRIAAEQASTLKVIEDGLAKAPAVRQVAAIRKIIDAAEVRARANARKLDHVTALRREYERAARYPWLRVAPDPTEPQRPPRPMRIPRFTTRLMPLVPFVVVALCIAVRRARLLRHATYHEDQSILTMTPRGEAPRITGDTIVGTPGADFSATPRSSWHASMASKYRDAAAQPWLPVPPDPPPPD